MEPRSRLEELLGDEQGRAELRRAHCRGAGGGEPGHPAAGPAAHRLPGRSAGKTPGNCNCCGHCSRLLPEQRRQRAEDAAALMHLARMLDLLRELDIIDEDGGIDL